MEHNIVYVIFIKRTIDIFDYLTLFYYSIKIQSNNYGVAQL